VNLKEYNKFRDPERIVLKDLKKNPILNFVIPAWEEENDIDRNITALLNLNYPKYKIIINAGKEKTYSRIKSYKEKFEKTLDTSKNNIKREFILLKQEGKGKLHAVNRCLDYVEKGIVAFIDFDTNITEEYVYRHVYEIVNNNKKVVVCAIRPYENQKDLTLPKYITIFRNRDFYRKFERELSKDVFLRSGCFFIDYEFIKNGGKFNDKIIGSECYYQGSELARRGYKIYQLKHPEAHIKTDYPKKLKEYFNQMVKFYENKLISKVSKKRTIRQIISQFLLFLVSLTFFASVILSFFHLFFLILLVLILESFYLKRIRTVIFYSYTENKRYDFDLDIVFYLSIFVYIVVELLVNIYSIIEFVFFSKKIKQKKNI